MINARLARAAEEASGMEAYDYLLINDDLDRCVEEMHQLIQLQHRKLPIIWTFKQDEKTCIT